VSVRRLAAEQPETFAFSKDSEKKVSFWMNKYPAERKASAVIPLLWLAQKQEGWVSEPAMREIATRCAMPYIRVYEVATFYTMFNLEPVGEHLIQVCGTTPCWLRGADDLKAVCEKRIGKKGRGHISTDGKFSWEEVECLGACANAPMVQISNRDGDYYYEDLTAEALETILDDLAAGKAVEQGPVTARTASEPFEAKMETLVEASLFDGSRAKPITLPNISGSGAGEPEPATEKRPTDDRQKTQAKTGKATAKPAPRSKKEADKPEDAQPKKPAKPRASKKTEG
jgi:NADH-quinone oxidoreductase subunit E